MSSIKRVKILTYTNTPNYGALLQAFALKEYVNSLGNECGTIDYFNPSMLRSQITGWKRVRSFFWELTFLKVFQSQLRKKRTESFRQTFFRHKGSPFSSCADLKQLNENTDVFIVGSDQVWNPSINANDPAFLLAFTDKKKVAHAASFGTSAIPKRYLLENRELFKAFDSISVREESSAAALLSEIGIEAQTVCDPVFLLDREDWRQKLKLTENVREKYVLCYIMPGNREVSLRIYALAAQIARKLHAFVIVLGEKPYKRDHGVFRYDHDCGPIEFVEYINNAGFVITNSFHGTAFSIIFRKDFYTVMKREAYSRNTRMENLLNYLRLSSRSIYTDAAIGSEVFSTVDYRETEALLRDYLDSSKRFLVDSI